MLVYSNQLKFIDDYILKNKERTTAKQISSDKLFKPGLPSSPLSLRFPSQETIAERVKIKPQERKKNRNNIPILLAQVKAGNNSYKLKNKIRQILYLLHQHNKITKKVYNKLIKSL